MKEAQKAAEEKKRQEEEEEAAKKAAAKAGIFGFNLFGDDEEEDFQGDENLPSFWCAVNGRDQKHWYTQETYNRNQLGI